MGSNRDAIDDRPLIREWASQDRRPVTASPHQFHRIQCGGKSFGPTREIRHPGHGAAVGVQRKLVVRTERSYQG